MIKMVGNMFYLYEDFPGNTYLDDGLTHEIIQCGDKQNLNLTLGNDKKIDNVVGYFTLFKEKVK